LCIFPTIRSLGSGIVACRPLLAATCGRFVRSLKIRVSGFVVALSTAGLGAFGGARSAAMPGGPNSQGRGRGGRGGGGGGGARGGGGRGGGGGGGRGGGQRWWDPVWRAEKLKQMQAEVCRFF